MFSIFLMPQNNYLLIKWHKSDAIIDALNSRTCEWDAHFILLQICSNTRTHINTHMHLREFKHLNKDSANILKIERTHYQRTWSMKTIKLPFIDCDIIEWFKCKWDLQLICKCTSHSFGFWHYPFRTRFVFLA